MIYYRSGHIESIYASLKDSEKIKILSSAIDHMQQCNKKSKFLCIAMAMGYRNHENNHNIYCKINENRK